MRRDLLLTLAGVTVLVPSAIFFFQSDDPLLADPTHTPGKETSADSTKRTAERAHQTPISREERLSSELPPAPPADPAKLITATLDSLSALDERARDTAIADLIAKLRASGPPGMEAVRAFFTSGRDLPLRQGYSLSGSKLTQAPSFRMALIEGLREWPGSAAIMLEVLKSPASVAETALAIRNLEKQFPGTYRTEAIEALKRRFAPGSPVNFGYAGESFMLEVAQHYRAAELIPELEAWMRDQPALRAEHYQRTISVFPDEARGPAMDRFLADPKVQAAFDTNAFNQFSYTDPRVRNFAARVFIEQWSPEQRANALRNFGPAPAVHLNTFFTDPHDPEFDKMNNARNLAEARSRKELLAQIAPAADTPEVQSAVKKAVQSVTFEISLRDLDRRHASDPAQEVEFGSGEGKAIIKGRSIQELQLRSEPVPVQFSDEDSTPPAPR